MSLRHCIVFLDDEADLAEALAEYFTDLGHEALVAADGIALEALLRSRAVDLVVMDLNLPGRSGFDLLAEVEALREVAVIFLSGRAETVDRVIGLELGADDFLSKPVDPRELAARAASVLARRGRGMRALLTFETTSADLALARVLRADGTTEALSGGEVALLRTFAAHPHRVLTREDLIAQAPAEDAAALDRAVDARVARLRRKLDTGWIETVRGHGYCFRPPWRD